MQFVLQFIFFTLAPNKIFQDLKSFLVACLYSLGIVKNISLVIGKHNLVIDAVLASLALCLEEATNEKYRCY